VRSLCEEKRGIMQRQEYLSNGKVAIMVWDIPLSEMITDFFDKLKSLSSGYASLDYEHKMW
jgi:GTP-binding protein LepA